MVFVVGDIHGEFKKLENLISNIINVDTSPTFIFIGDYIDKGKHSKEVLDYLLDLNTKQKCIFLWGNHEYMWYNLKKSYKIEKYGGQQTIDSLKTSDKDETVKVLKQKYSSFFKDLKRNVVYKNYFITHSGVPLKYMTTDQKDIPLKELLFNRHEFIDSNELYKDKFKVIFGHTAFYQPYVDNFKIGIDTGACYYPKQPLTSFCIDQEFFINSKGEINNLEKNKPDIIYANK